MKKFLSLATGSTPVPCLTLASPASSYSSSSSSSTSNALLSSRGGSRGGPSEFAAPAAAPRPLQIGPKGVATVRLLMVGDTSTGKTSLVLRFDQNVFSSRFVSTIGIDYREKSVSVTGTRMTLQVWDTAGQERFHSLTSNFFGRGDGFLLCYDVSSRPSFVSVQRWLADIEQRAPADSVVVLVGSKSDVPIEDRAVGREEGAALARLHGIRFAEASAKTGDGVEEIFTALAKAIKETRSGGGEGRRRGGGAPASGPSRTAVSNRGGRVARDTEEEDRGKRRASSANAGAFHLRGGSGGGDRAVGGRGGSAGSGPNNCC